MNCLLLSASDARVAYILWRRQRLIGKISFPPMNALDLSPIVNLKF